MASYFNITLDTTAPKGVGIKINGDDIRTVSQEVALNITCSDADTTGYKMKVWGDIYADGSLTNIVDSESAAAWEDFSPTKNVRLVDLGGSITRTVYVKLRDALWNQSEIASDDIILYTELPKITITSGPLPAKITTWSDKSGSLSSLESVAAYVGSFSTVIFTVNKDVSDVKVVLAQTSNALQGDESNIILPSSEISRLLIASESEESGYAQISGENGICATGVNIPAGTEFRVAISGDDLKSVSSEDGVKLIKIFVKEKDASWSI